MTTNSVVAEAFRAIADLLDLKGEKFKPEAYRRAARSIEGLGEDLRAIAARGALDQIPGVGEALRDKILEFLKDGHIPYYDRLQAEFPPGLLDLMRVPGVGPKTTGRFYGELGVDSPSALLAAIDAGRLDGVAGFGERKIEKLRQSLVQTRGGLPARTPLRTAWELARSILRGLSERAPMQSIDVAGSLRRRRETVGDLDVLVTSSDPPATIGVFVALPGVEEVVLKGDTKATVRHAPGIQVDLRVVDPESFGAALQYFTGSKDHNVRLRSLARERGLKINEYGVFRGEERVAGRTEADVYGTLGMPWIPPELRENQGEVEAALEGKLPTLVGLGDVRGELHRHISGTTSVADLATLLRRASELGLRYVGVVVRPPDGRSLSDAPLDAVRACREEGRAATAQLLVGAELTLEALREEGELPPEIDYIVGRPSDPVDGPPTAPLGRAPLFLAHLGPALGAGGAGGPSDAWMSWAREADVALEVTPDAVADGLDSAGVRRFVASKGRVVVSAGAPATADLAPLELAVGLARRGSAGPGDVLNTSESPALARRRPPARGPRRAHNA
jgi:DNA polymerase (family 10)